MLALNSLFIIFAAFLWATDSFFRYPLLGRGFSSASIVFTEHLIALFFLIVFVMYKKIKIFKLQKKEWLSLCFIGLFSSALATVLFTMSFNYGNPSVSILLQKFQPLVVIFCGAVFLKEKLTRSFYVYASLAISAGFFLSFPDLNFSIFSEPKNIWEILRPAVLAISAAVLWALGTVVGKNVLKSVQSSVVVFWRYFFGLFGVVLIALVQGQSINSVELFSESKNIQSLMYMSLIVGLFSMVLYYQGLKTVKASVATVFELTFPIAAVVINYFFLDQKLNLIQLIAGSVLVFVMTRLVYSQQVKPNTENI